jgi:hypothetical protein
VEKGSGIRRQREESFEQKGAKGAKLRKEERKMLAGVS